MHKEGLCTVELKDLFDQVHPAMLFFTFQVALIRLRVHSMRNSSTVKMGRQTVPSQTSRIMMRQISRQTSNKKSKECRIRRPSNKLSLRRSKLMFSAVGQSFHVFIRPITRSEFDKIRIQFSSSRLGTPWSLCPLCTESARTPSMISR